MTRPKRSNREGGKPRQRRYGRWQADYTGGDGKRHSIIAPTVTECRERLRAAIRQAEDGTAPPSYRPTVGGWLDTWLKDYVAGGLEPKAPGTVEMYESIVRVHIKPRLGSVVLSRLTREQVAQALADMKLAPSSLSRVYVIFGAALDEAVRSERIRTNPVRRLPSPTVEHQERVTWTADAINRFLDAIEGDRLAPLLAFAIATGLRQGELLGLR